MSTTRFTTVRLNAPLRFSRSVEVCITEIVCWPDSSVQHDSHQVFNQFTQQTVKIETPMSGMLSFIWSRRLSLF